MLRNIFSRGDYLIPAELLGPVSTILDLGAYSGISTLYFAERYPDASIMALEPDAENFACLERNLRTLSGSGTRVRALQACVADRIGIVSFSSGGPHWARSIVDVGEARVKALTMLEVLRLFGHERVDLLKMDIEGGERLAMKSAAEWLPRVGWILMEVHFSAMSLANLAETLGPSRRDRMLRRDRGSGRWTEVTRESYARAEAEAPVLEILIPPAA